MSAAMWDAWAAYDTTAGGVFFTERATAANVAAARREAISYAAYRTLVQRYEHATETPPGHWFVLANHVADHPMTTRQLFGTGTALDPLSWDVHVYLALGGAVHDAAITAWQIKRRYTAMRPISAVRYMAQLGQSSDPAGPDYHPYGLPLVPGVVERVTAESSAPGQRHANLRRCVGQLAVRSWRGEPGDHAHEVGRVDWIRAVDWTPYQRRTAPSRPT